MIRTVLYVVAFLSALLLNGCGSDNHAQKFSTEALISMDINDSHSAISGQFGVPRTYRQIDTNGSFSPEGGVFRNGDSSGEGNSTIDFNQSDVALYSMAGASNTKYYFATRLAEYPSYVVLLGEIRQRIDGGAEFNAPKSSAWLELSKYNKPILYDERLYYTMYKTEEQLYYDTPIKIETESKGVSFAFEVLAEGSVATDGRVGKHYEKVVSRERLATLYASVGIDPEMADTVDFTQYSVLALVMGSTDTSNASITLKGVYGVQWDSNVSFEETHLNNNAESITPFYQIAYVENAFAISACKHGQYYVPYQFVAVPTTVHELVFVDSAQPVACK